MAALRAAELGARTTLVTRDDFGGMAANDGPVPVRTLAHAARLMRGARKLDRYGIAIGAARARLFATARRVREVVDDVRRHSTFREQIDRLGVTLHERTGQCALRRSPHDRNRKRTADAGRPIILCAGGTNRRLSVPGAELTATHSDAWSLTRSPAVDAGHRRRHDRSAGRIDLSGVRLAACACSSEPRAFFRARTRTCRLPSRGAFAPPAWSCARTSAPSNRSRERRRHPDELLRETASATASRPNLRDRDRLGGGHAGIESPAGRRRNGCARLQSRSTPVFAPPRRMSTPLATSPADGCWSLRPCRTAGSRRRTPCSGTSACARRERLSDRRLHRARVRERRIDGSEGARDARRRHGDSAFRATTRTIIDGRTDGFCKLLVDRATRTILGCHVVGERAVEIVQVVAIAMSSSFGWRSSRGFHSRFPPTPESSGAPPTARSSSWDYRVDGFQPDNEHQECTPRSFPAVSALCLRRRQRWLRIRCGAMSWKAPSRAIGSS